MGGHVAGIDGAESEPRHPGHDRSCAHFAVGNVLRRVVRAWYFVAARRRASVSTRRSIYDLFLAWDRPGNGFFLRCLVGAPPFAERFSLGRNSTFRFGQNRQVPRKNVTQGCGRASISCAGAVSGRLLAIKIVETTPGDDGKRGYIFAE